MDKENWIAVLKKIFFLKPLPTILIAVPSYVLVFFVLANESVPMQVAYFLYILSAYAFIITITGFPKIMTSISGGVVCTFVLAMAIYMLVRSTRYLKNQS
jgi:hypothetical protein